MPGADGAGLPLQLVNDGFNGNGVVADNHLAHGVHRDLQGGKEGIADHAWDEGVTNALDSLVGVKFDGHEVPGAGADGYAFDQGIIGGDAHYAGVEAGYFHCQSSFIILSLVIC